MLSLIKVCRLSKTCTHNFREPNFEVWVKRSVVDIESLIISTVRHFFFSFYLRLHPSVLKIRGWEFSHTSAPYIPHSAFLLKHLGDRGRGSMVKVKVLETGVGAEAQRMLKTFSQCFNIVVSNICELRTPHSPVRLTQYPFINSLNMFQTQIIKLNFILS